MNCIFLRRGYGTSGDGVNYVEYIESSGTQYIDTGFVPNQNTRVVMDIQQTNVSQAAFFGARTSTSANMYVFFLLSKTQVRTDFGTSKNTVNVTSTLERFVVDKNKATTTFGEYSTTNTESNFTAPCNMTLFAVNTAGKVGTFAIAKLYSCQIYDNGTLVKDFYPAKDPDGIACLYEKVSKTYFYNKGTGTFTAGGSDSGGDDSGGGTTPSEYTVTLKGTMSSPYSQATISGKTYASANTVTISPGTEVMVQVGGTGATGYIYLNGAQVATGADSAAKYTFVPSSDVTVTFSRPNGTSVEIYRADITTS